MPAVRLQASSFLHYNPDYRVLICRRCQYAIQKDAIDSHLLKHKIYRGDRQNLLDETAQLNLLDPEDVVQPLADSPAIDGLPVLHGYRCTLGDCRHLAVSEKRMKRHCSEVHRLGVSLPPLRAFARPVDLQTFFRGTKVRYFEVSAPSGQQPGTGHVSAKSDSISATQPIVNSRESRADSARDASAASNERSPTTVGIATLQACRLDLDMIRYYHHFITVTVPTLPGSWDYWQAKLETEALQHNSITCGVLAISASHMAFCATSPLSARFHTETQERLACEFLSYNGRSTTDGQARQLGNGPNPYLNQLSALIYCAQRALAETSVDREIVPQPPNLAVVLDMIRACIAAGSDVSISTYPQASHAEVLPKCVGLTEPDESAGDSTPSVLLHYLQSLPHRMAETLGRPTSTQDLIATLSAIAALVECSTASFASDHVTTVWQGAVSWLNKVPVHFNAMMNRYDPAALVVLAHWAAIPAKRAGLNGCWFLKGAARFVLSQVVSQLSAMHPAVLCLVEDLMANSNG